MPLRHALLAATIVLISGVLRLSGLEHMEYKRDEEVMFSAAMSYRDGGPWPRLGMPSSRGLRNPGLSMGVFGIMAVATGADDPVALDRVVAALGTLAIAAVCLFAFCRPTSLEREQWLWVAALAGVNVFLVTMHRKLWAQSVIALPVMVLLAAWWLRDRRWAAFTWGLLGSLVGQVHMAGVFFALALAAATLLLARGSAFRPVRWGPWCAGAALGALPVLPWLPHFQEWHNTSTGVGVSLTLIGAWRFFRHWLLDALGLPGRHSLGEEHLQAFLAYPLVGDVRTFGVLLAHVAVAAVAAVVALGVWRNRPTSPAAVRDILLGRRSQAEFLLVTAFGVYGLLLYLLGLSGLRHYLLLTFPLEWLWIVLLAFAAGAGAARRALAVLVVANLLITASFLQYIERNGGAPGAEYGVAYSKQQR